MNTPQRRRTSQRRPGRPADSKPIDIWRPVPPLPDPEPIVAAAEPVALLRSLGDPPLGSKSVVAGHYVASVIERAAMMASALAASADLLGKDDAED